MKKYIKFLSLVLFLSSQPIKAQCTWTIKWGLDCTSPIIAVQGCGSTSSVTSFICNSPTDPDCGCNDVPVFASKTVGAINPLCNCDCSNVYILLNGVPFYDGDIFCCGSPGDICIPCKCGKIVIDCNNKIISFEDPCP